MKMKKLFAICLVALSALISVHLQAQEVETLVLIDTDMGKIKVKLFNDTPQHRDNFIKNVKEHRYDGSYVPPSHARFTDSKTYPEISREPTYSNL